MAAPQTQTWPLTAAQAWISPRPRWQKPPTLASLPSHLQICLSSQDMAHSVSFCLPYHTIFAYHNSAQPSITAKCRCASVFSSWPRVKSPGLACESFSHPHVNGPGLFHAFSFCPGLSAWVSMLFFVCLFSASFYYQYFINVYVHICVAAYRGQKTAMDPLDVECR